MKSVRNKSRYTAVLWIFIGSLLLVLGAACSLILGSQGVDSQSATLTALVTPTVVQPTLDLKGNEVLESQTCLVDEVVSVDTFTNARNGGIFGWAGNKDLFAYVAPENRYWAWFSGDAVVLDFSSGAQKIGEISTSGAKVFGDFTFSPKDDLLAFTAFRSSDKVYTVMVGDISSGLKTVTDLFPGAEADSDTFSSEKSVIEWQSEDELRVSSSCGIDCEQIMLVNVKNNSRTFEKQVRKYEQTGHDFPMNVKEYDQEQYPVMVNPNWSPDFNYVFYTDTQNKAWIIQESSKSQYELPVTDAAGILQTSWSYDAKYIALRYEESIQIYQLGCTKK